MNVSTHNPKKTKLNTLDFYYLIYLFYSLVSFKLMHRPKNSKCVIQAYQNQLFEMSTENKNNDIFVQKQKAHYKYNFIKLDLNLYPFMFMLTISIYDFINDFF